MSRLRLRFVGRGTPTPSPSPTPTPSSTYDTSIGLGVTDGFADLTKRSGGRYIFVGNGGSDGANGLSHANRLATMAAAAALVTPGQGDQILIAEGSTYSVSLPDLNGLSGFSAAYPTVIQSYDTAVPTDATKYGKATTNRPVLTAATHPINFIAATANIALRGIKFDPGNISGTGFSWIGDLSYCLFENCIFAYSGLGFDHFGTGPNPGIIIRRCSFYGVWGPTGNLQSVFVGTASSHTVEDCIFWHSGWKIGGAGRDDASEGATALRHCTYSPVDTDLLARRNIYIDPSATGISARGNATAYDNVFIRCPIAMTLTVEVDHTKYRPSGIDLQIYNNALFTGTALDHGGNINISGWGLSIAGSVSGSAAHHNLIAHSANPIVNQGEALRVDASHATRTGVGDINEGGPDLPTYIDLHHNRIIKWDTDRNLEDTGDNRTALHITARDSVWDVLPTNPTPYNATTITISNNTLNSGLTYPTEYTSVDQLAAALGYTDEATWIAAMIRRPDLDWVTEARLALGTGYGMTWA